jgi:hypothetical protein
VQTQKEPDFYLLPATDSTLEEIPKLLRGEIQTRLRLGAPRPSELAARCYRNYTRRQKHKGGRVTRSPLGRWAAAG